MMCPAVCPFSMAFPRTQDSLINIHCFSTEGNFFIFIRSFPFAFVPVLGTQIIRMLVLYFSIAITFSLIVSISDFYIPFYFLASALFLTPNSISWQINAPLYCLQCILSFCFCFFRVAVQIPSLSFHLTSLHFHLSPTCSLLVFFSQKF